MSDKKSKKEKKDKPSNKKKEKKEEEYSEKAFPLSPIDLQKTIVDFVREVSEYKDSLKKGANEVTKALNRGKAKLVILAADTDPLEILLHLPLLCEDKNVPYIFVRSSQTLGRAAGLSRGVIAACILENKKNDSFKKKTEQLVDEIERTLTH